MTSLSEDDDVALSLESKCFGDFGIRLLSESNSFEITLMVRCLVRRRLGLLCEEIGVVYRKKARRAERLRHVSGKYRAVLTNFLGFF